MLNLFCCLFFALHGAFSGYYNYQNRQYFYQVQADENQKGRWRLLIRNIEGKDSYIAYNTIIHIKENGKNVEHIKIFGASQQSYLWTALTTDFWRANFSEQQISYERKGELMQKTSPTTEIWKVFNKNQSVEELSKKAIEQFIREYHHLFSFAENKKTEKGIISGKVGEFSYQFTENFYQKDYHNLKIRNAEKSLVYETLIRYQNQDDFSVQIHWSKLQNWAWAIYESDFIAYTFDKKQGKVISQKNGGVMPFTNVVRDLPQISQQEQGLQAAINYFVEDYGQYFLKE